MLLICTDKYTCSVYVLVPKVTRKTKLFEAKMNLLKNNEIKKYIHVHVHTHCISK